MLRDYRKYSTVIIAIGLGIIFLANSYVAFASPDDFVKLISSSFLINFQLSGDLLVKFIGLSDGIVGILLIAGIFRKYVSFYASLWILGVIIVIGFSALGDTIEHLGLLAMPIYLLLNSKES